jgi:hypothetical protein
MPERPESTVILLVSLDRVVDANDRSGGMRSMVRVWARGTAISACEIFALQAIDVVTPVPISLDAPICVVEQIPIPVFSKTQPSVSIYHMSQPRLLAKERGLRSGMRHSP